MMKFIMVTISFLVFAGFNATAQKLYVQANPITEISTSYDSMNEYVDMIEAKHRNQSANLDLKGLNKRMFETIGDCKNMVLQSGNAERITQSILAKSMIHESEYQEYLKTLPDAGFFDFDSNQECIAVLNEKTSRLETIRTQIRDNKFEFQPNQEKSEENIQLLKEFNTSLNSILTSLERAYVEL